jgi:hypothetical protein
MMDCRALFTILSWTNNSASAKGDIWQETQTIQGIYAVDSTKGVLKGIDSKFGWLRGLDLNQRPLGYEGHKKRIINELDGMFGGVEEP